MSNTTYRRLTGVGRSALAQIEISGAAALDVADAVFKPRKSRFSEVEARKLSYGDLWSGDEIVDDVIATWKPMPDGEIVLITCHGGTRIVERFIEELERRGVRRLASEQAELPDSVAIRNIDQLIDVATQRLLYWSERVSTKRAACWVAWQMKELTEAIRATQAESCSNVALTHSLEHLSFQTKSALRILSGARVALVGQTNSGKSTLANKLAGHEMSLAWDGPGTTLDWVGNDVEMRGIPVTLIDTAGFRMGAGRLEVEAISTGAGKADDSDLAIVVLDGTSPRLSEEANDWIDHLKKNDAVILAVNKIDLVGPGIARKLNLRAGSPQVIEISALKDYGVDALEGLVEETLLGAGFRDFQPTIPFYWQFN